jgi:hypothetical protein
MNLIAFQILTVLVSAGGPAAAPENTLLTELVTKGVTMPDGQVVQLPPPLMPDGLTAAQQADVLKRAAPRGNVLAFTGTQSSALLSLKVATSNAQGTDLIRTVNVCFVVYGDWEVLTSKSFSDTILRPNKANNQNNQGGTAVSKAGYLKAPEMAVRRLTARSTPNLKEYFLYTDFRLFGEVDISATRFGMATKTPTGVVVAAKVDPRFADDKQYPNQWRPIVRNAAGNPVVGEPQPYPRADSKGVSGAGFYAKVTRLSAPANAIFVEYHSAFYEPQSWFGVGNGSRLPAELGKIVPYQVKQFRMKLRKASDDAAKGTAASKE